MPSLTHIVVLQADILSTKDNYFVHGDEVLNGEQACSRPVWWPGVLS